jgi:hypothetical protein
VPEREGVTSLPYYDDPEALKLARKASLQMMDIEHIIEMQNRLPEESRFGGEYGLLSAMGYAGDYPQTGENARIGSFGEFTGEGGEYLARKRGTLLGLYTPKASTQEHMSTDALSRQTLLEGREPGKLHYYVNRDVIGGLLEQEDLPRELAPVRIADILSHELLHRGTDVLPLKDLEEFANEKAEEFGWKWPETRRNYQRAAIVFRDIQKTVGEHEFTDFLKRFNLGGGDIEKLSRSDRDLAHRLTAADSVLREFLTPERQEEYGLRLIDRASKPKEEKGIGAFFQGLLD